MTNNTSDGVREIQQLKCWLDIELTLLHIGFYILLGLIVGGKIWWFCGIAIFVSVIYMVKKASKLPKGYLK